MASQRDSDSVSPSTPIVWVLGQAVLVTGLICLYFGVRGLTVGSRSDAVANAHRVVDAEKDLHVAVEGAVQSWISGSELLVDVANWIYIWGHWPVIIVTMIWLATRHRDVFRRLRDAMMMSGAVGMIIFARFPVAPPRLAGLGLIDTVTERSDAYRVLQPPAFVNQYAAMPSLHVGWDLLVGMSIFTAAPCIALKMVGVVMPILMAFAVLATANHYVLDVIAGIALVLIAHVLALAVQRRRLTLRRRRADAMRRWASMMED